MSVAVHPVTGRPYEERLEQKEEEKAQEIGAFDSKAIQIVIAECEAVILKLFDEFCETNETAKTCRMLLERLGIRHNLAKAAVNSLMKRFKKD